MLTADAAEGLRTRRLHAGRRRGWVCVTSAQQSIVRPDLSGLPVLDPATGLSFIFLLLSLLATAIQELIAVTLALRARSRGAPVELWLNVAGGG